MIEAIKKFLTGLPGMLAKVLKSSQFQKAQGVAKSIGDLLPYAMPAIQVVATFTPNKADDEIVALLNTLMMPVSVPAGATLSDYEKRGLLLAAANTALRGKLAEAIAEAGGVGIMIGGQYIKSKDAIPDSLVDAACQNAYSFLRNTAAQE